MFGGHAIYTHNQMLYYSCFIWRACRDSGYTIGMQIKIEPPQIFRVHAGWSNSLLLPFSLPSPSSSPSLPLPPPEQNQANYNGMKLNVHEEIMTVSLRDPSVKMLIWLPRARARARARAPVPPHPPDSANHTTTFLDKSPQVRMQRYLVHSPGLHTLGQPAAIT